MVDNRDLGYGRVWRLLYGKEILYRQLCDYNHKEIINKDEQSSVICLLNSYT